MTQPSLDINRDQAALDVARGLVAIGIPVFAAHPDPGQSTGFRLPPQWQRTRPDPHVVDSWRPGMALALVCGHGLDLVDFDVHKGGHPNALNGTLPTSYAAASTPSGGAHSFVHSLGVRSRDNVLPGIDVKAGTPDGGHGFAFIAPTWRASKTTGRPAPYAWVSPPDLARLSAVLRGEVQDLSGRGLAELIHDVRRGAQPPIEDAPYLGPPFAELPLEEQTRVARYMSAALGRILRDLDASAAWPEGHTNASGAGWERLQADAAYQLGRFARAPWNPLTLDEAEALFLEHAPSDASWTVDRIESKWRVQSVRGTPAPYPPSMGEREAVGWAALGVDVAGVPMAVPPVEGTASVSVVGTGTGAPLLDDSHLSETLANEILRGSYCWSRGLGWMRYAGGRWQDVSDETITERVRLWLIELHAREARAGAEPLRLKALSGVLSAAKARALVSLLRGHLEVSADDFDRHPDLLCVGNGVVDLSTGQLYAHDPALMMTRRTAVAYDQGARSGDWDAALTALPDEVAAWLQVRVGQAVTGHPTSDDVLPVLQGGGSNGKTTLMAAIVRALGDHAVTVPERVLLAHPSDHPTELMTLRGARLALIEETPEGRRLSVKRLKDVLGTPTMTARAIRRDNVTWQASHSLLLTTNYRPAVDESDHGTWRRLALVRFPYTYATPGEAAEVPDGPDVRPAAAGLRERLRDGRSGEHEAVLAWVVAGALRWYGADRVMPPAPAAVVADTRAWRHESDLVLAFVDEVLVFDAEAHVMATELFEAFTAYLMTRQHKPWAEKTFSSRFGEHGTVQAARIEKQVIRPRAGLSMAALGAGHVPSRPAPTKQYTAWLGVRFRTDADEAEAPLSPSSSDPNNGSLTWADRAGVKGVKGPPYDAHARAFPTLIGGTLHTLHTPSIPGGAS